MEELLEQSEGLSHWIYVGALIVAILILNRIIHWVLSYLANKAQPDKRPWRHAVLSSLDAPARAFLWLIGIIIALHSGILTKHYISLGQWLPTTRKVLMIVIFTWFFFRLIKRVQHNVRMSATTNSKTVDPTLIDAVGKITMAIVVIVALISIMQAFSIPLSGLLAFGGAAGIAVGFAAQNLVANLFGGLTVFASRIFKIGEAIIIPGTDLVGDVEHIGWRSTRVMGWDCKPFYVPNSLFNTSSVINHSRLTARVASENLYLRYADFDKLEAISKRGNQMLEQHEGIDYCVFRFASFEEKALRMYLYAYVKTKAYAEFMEIKEDVLFKLAAIVRDEGAELILPLSHIKFDDHSDTPVNSLASHKDIAMEK